MVRLTITLTAPGESWRLLEALSSLTVPTHQGSDRFPRLLAVIEKALLPPQILFDLPGGTRGLDYVREIRRQGKRPEGKRPL